MLSETPRVSRRDHRVHGVIRSDAQICGNHEGDFSSGEFRKDRSR
jgi:hypothetical protein